MIWVTLRQHRPQILVTVLLLFVLGAFLLVHGLLTVSAKADVAAGELEDVLGNWFRFAYQGLSWMPMFPLLIGVFWGAPVLAREFERGTYRVAWTQSVSRRRWVVTKLAVLGGLVFLAGLAHGGMVSLWLGAFDGTFFAARFSSAAFFGGTGVAVGAWWLFAFMLGAAGGAVFRRLLPAMAVTVAVFIAVSFAVLAFGREMYAEPVVMAESGATAPFNSMIVDSGWRDASGREAEPPLSVCSEEAASSYMDCMRAEGYEPFVRIHPSDRYWRFQWTEAGLLLALTALLAAATVRTCQPSRIRRRL